jgi:hypothetical protein
MFIWFTPVRGMNARNGTNCSPGHGSFGITFILGQTTIEFYINRSNRLVAQSRGEVHINEVGAL